MSDDHSHADNNGGNQPPAASPVPASQHETESSPSPQWPKELGGPKGPEPTRYGDWERNGRCSDF